jgi:hypothetical protein
MPCPTCGAPITVLVLRADGSTVALCGESIVVNPEGFLTVIGGGEIRLSLAEDEWLAIKGLRPPVAGAMLLDRH